MQSKKNSVIEAIINTFLGFIISLFTSPIANYLFDVKMSIGQNIQVTIFMTVVSFLRSYIVRRYCNQYLDDLNYKLQTIIK
jgi:hypothetical protein